MATHAAKTKGPAATRDVAKPTPEERERRFVEVAAGSEAGWRFAT